VTEKGGGRVNMVQKVSKHVCKCKNDTCGTAPGNQEE
jgi:hypothetical protein